MKNLDQLFADINKEIAKDQQKLPPVMAWNPPLSGDIDIVITRSGQWLHEGTVIARKELVKVFSSILKREGDDYFLVTPVEKWRIRVEDAPFYVVKLEPVVRDGVQFLVFTTATDEQIVAGPEHPIRVVSDNRGEPSPYLCIRQGMEGLLSRPVFYQLVELAVAEGGGKREGEDKTPGAVRGVYSAGVFFPLE